MTRSLRHLRPALITPRGLLYETDCFNLFAALQDETIDCVFADPPFNLGKDYGNGRARDALGGQEYLKWTAAWLDECVRLMKPGAAMFVYILPQWGYRLASHLEDRGLEFRHWIALSMKAGFLRGLKLYPAHYAILYFTKGRPKTFNRVRLPIPTCRHCNRSIKDYGGHRKHLNPSGLNLTDFWEDTAPARHQRFKARSHINELKLMIPMRCLQIATQPDCQRSPHSEPPGSGKQSHPGSPKLSQAGSPMLSHPGAGIVSHPARRDRISFAYPQPPCVAVGNKFVAGGDAHGWTEESGDRHPRVASPSAVGRA